MDRAMGGKESRDRRNDFDYGPSRNDMRPGYPVPGDQHRHPHEYERRGDYNDPRQEFSGGVGGGGGYRPADYPGNMNPPPGVASGGGMFNSGGMNQQGGYAPDYPRGGEFHGPPGGYAPDYPREDFHGPPGQGGMDFPGPPAGGASSYERGGGHMGGGFSQHERENERRHGGYFG